jgi:Bacteriocin-protection, YdeI or OmpD-Associated/Domain of unknown function (DUF1905)
MTNEPHRFQATIYRIWMMRHIDVPDDVARELQRQMRGGNVDGVRRRQSNQPRNASAGSSARQAQEKWTGSGKRDRANVNAPQPKYIPVVAIVNGKLARTTLVPAGGGRFRMQINTALRKAARADVGDLVGVELRLDRESRELPVPADLRAGLKSHPKAWKAFQALAPGHRRHFISWFDSAKSASARSRRLGRAVDALLERAMLGSNRERSRSAKSGASRRTRVKA